ncbi:MAG: excalibur calcium-binding domain-containing protein [SAR324 cluster bacterium]|nr:excalibur calcium-binding domain-containing protein [SAR324 cluster bacterium]
MQTSTSFHYLHQCGISRLDGDKDGLPCEGLCD